MSLNLGQYNEIMQNIINLKIVLFWLYIDSIQSATAAIKFWRLTRSYDRSSRKSWDARIRHTAVKKYPEKWWSDAIRIQRRWHPADLLSSVSPVLAARKRVLLCVLTRIASPIGMQKHSWNSPRNAPFDHLPDWMITIFQLARTIHWLDVKSWLRMDYTKWFIFLEEKSIMIYKAILFPR